MPVAPQVPPVPGNAEDNRLPLSAESLDVWPPASYNGLSLSVHVCSRVTWLDARRRMAAGDCAREDQRRMKTIDASTTATVPVVTDDDGVMRVGETRVTLDTVIGAFLDGAAAEEIVFQYPSLDLGDVYSVLGYYLRRRPEVDSYLQRRREQIERARQQNETRFDPAGVRDRLLARRANGSL